jgi:NDP-sugar pyrophosphorylase family protein
VKAMLLAAGQGIRLRPLTNTVPKSMIPIGGKPILEHNIEWLCRYGITELAINLYYLPHVIQDYFGDGSRWGVKITYSLEPRKLGTAGGVKRFANFFDETFLVWYGDNLSTCDLSRLLDFHRAKEGLATIAIYQREDVTQSGIIGLDDQERITRFQEKPKIDQIFSHWVNAGIYILNLDVLEFIPNRTESDFGKDVFPAMLAAGRFLYGYRMTDSEKLWWIDTPDDLLVTQSALLRRKTS